MELPSNATVLGKLRNHQLRTEESLQEMHRYMQALDLMPFLGLKAVHVAGTKGKGSTCAFLESLLRYHGQKTGLFTSPHLISPAERIRIGGSPIVDESFSKIAFDLRDRIRAAALPLPGFFRFTCLMAMQAFLEASVDWAIMEVGIGGRFDCTNIVQPQATAITSLAMDHGDVLGGTRASIAWHKAGIMKRGIPCYTHSQQHPEAAAILQQEAARLGAPLCLVDPLPLRSLLGLGGEHQRGNAALAVAMASHLGFPSPAASPLAAAALASTRLLGRQTKIQRGQTTWYLDGAHTPESTAAVAEWFRTEQEDGRSLLLFYCSAERDAQALLAPLQGLCNQILQVSHPRDQVSEAMQLAQGYSRVLVTGSFYLVGAVLEHLQTRETKEA